MNHCLTAALGAWRLFCWFTLRHLRSHWGRSLAVLLGIALGAAVFTSVRLAVHATVAAYSSSMDLLSGAGDLTLLYPGHRVPETIVAALMQHPDVRSASPILSAYVRSADHEEPFLLIGLEPILDRDLRSWTVRSTSRDSAADWVSLMTEPGAMLIGRRLKQAFEWRPGQSVELIHAHQTARFTVQAVLDTDGLALVDGGRIALCDIATFQEFTGLFGWVDRIDLKLARHADAGLHAELQTLLPPGVVIRSPSVHSDAGRGMIQAYQLNLTFLSFISLFVGMFLVYSLVALNAAQRRREVALMRATGASKRLLFFLFLGEGAFIGLCGWFLAMPVSTLLVKHLLSGVSRTVSMLFIQVHVDALALNPWEILLSFGLTLGVAMLAALQPAREAMTVPPREALDIAPTLSLQPGLIRRMAVGGFGLLVLVYPLSRLPSPTAVSLSGYLAALLLFIGFALLTPLMLQQFARLMTPQLLRLGGQPAFLAAGYLKQSGVQTAISVGALITAVALFTALVVMTHSFRSTVVLWVQQSIAGDLYIRPKLAELNRFRDPLPHSVVAAIAALPADVQRVPIRMMELRINGHQHLFEAMDYADYTRRNRFVWMGGDTRQIESDLIAGKGVVVSEVFANRTGLGPGSRYRVPIGGQWLDAPILGIFRDYRTRGGAVYYALTHYQQRFNDRSWSGVQINFTASDAGRQAAMDQVRAALLVCCGELIEITEGDSLRRMILRIFDETFAIASILLLIALVVAALGIATTLAVMVIQRRHQLNIIRAVGGSTVQLRRMIFWEAGLIVAAGQSAGLVCGFILSTLLIFVVNRQSFGWTFLYRVDWPFLLMALPLIFLAAVLAALPAVKLALSTSPAALLRGDPR